MHKLKSSEIYNNNVCNNVKKQKLP